MSIHREKGFTLLELVMVIVILGILSAVAVPRFFTLQDSTKTSLFKSVTGAIKSGIGNAYALKHGEYPTLSEVLNNAFTTGEGNTESIMDASEMELSQNMPDAGVELIGAVPTQPSGESWESIYIYYPAEMNAEYYTMIWYNPEKGQVVDGL